MKTQLIIIFLSLSIFTVLNAQKDLPIIHTNSKELDFEDGLYFHEKGWTIDSDIKIDTYEAEYYRDDHRVTFYSDIDSISFKLSSGEYFDFLIIYNNTDTAYTRIKGIKIPPKVFKKPEQKRYKNSKDTIPLTIGDDNRIYIKMKVNGSKELDFVFDTGANCVVIKDSLLRSKEIMMTIDTMVTNQGSDGLTQVKQSNNNTIEAGNLIWKNIEVLSIDYQTTKFQGVAGWNLVEDKIVEINYSDNKLVLHEELPEDFNTYKKVRMRHFHGIHYIELCLVINDEKHCGWFEYDTGFSGILNINHQFAKEHSLKGKMETIAHGITSGSAHIDIGVEIVRLPEIQIGDIELYQIPVSLAEEIPNGINHDGILGNKFMKRFDTIIDYKRNQLYLRPNKFIHSSFKNDK